MPFCEQRSDFVHSRLHAPLGCQAAAAAKKAAMAAKKAAAANKDSA
jgi:hypothetical protein